MPETFLSKIIHQMFKQNMISLLPSPGLGRQGWPWTLEAKKPPALKTWKHWPKISIITPSYNQGTFIEETIRSILFQRYPNLEYIIVDGGSTDGTLDIIKNYEQWITYWISEPDRGMYDAINKGFERATGDIMAWSNTDDIYLPGAFHTIGSVFRQFQKIDWITSLWKVQWDHKSHEIKRYQISGFDRRAFKKGRNLLGRNPFATFMIQQQSTFWTRRLWERSGSRVDDSFLLAGDFELWSRFYKYADLYAIDQPLGVFRFQPDQKTANLSQDYLNEAEEAFKKNGGQYPSRIEGMLRTKLLSRIPEWMLWLISPLTYNSKIISSKNNDTWTVSRRCFL